MPEENQRETVQMNIASEQRNAGRDYYEFLVPGSIELFLATRSIDEIDRISLANEHLFRHRFGFIANRAVRKQVIEIKQRYDMTDYDIRWLQRSTQMTIRNNEANISPDRVSLVFAWINFSVLSYVCMTMLFQISFSSAPAWKQALATILVGGVWSGLAWVLKSLYVSPWRTVKRIRAFPTVGAGQVN